MKHIIFIIPLLILGSCKPCTCEEDSLDKVVAFKSENKYFKSALVSLHFMMETSPVDEVDTLFRQMIEIYNLPFTASEAKDGIYQGASPYDAFDYRHEVRIEIKEGKFAAVDYNEVHRNGKGKQEDVEYCEEMSVSGTTPAIAYPRMEEMLMSTQNMMEVDAVAGASYSLYRFRYAVSLALMQAMLDFQ